MMQVDVVLFAPPYFRFCGSHNSRISPSLVYLASYLRSAGISYVIYNADATAAEKYWSMRWLFRNFQSFVDAVDGKSNLYGEVVEIIMSFNPKAVVILGAEPLIATKDWADPFIAVHYSRMLRKLGIYTIGLGHFFTLDLGRFEEDFDCIMGGEPSTAVLDIIRQRPKGYIAPRPIDLNVLPLLTPCFPEKQRTDFVMTSFGCRFPCSFCLVQQFYKTLRQSVRFVDLDTVVADIRQRKEEQIYLTDLTFTIAPVSRLRKMAARLRAAGIKKSFTIDTRADCISEEVADVLVELNVERVKIGVEGGTDKMLELLNKGTNTSVNDRAIRILRDRNIKVITYLLIGAGTNEQDYETTRNYIQRIAPDFVPVAIWAYDLRSDYRYDTQFSPVRLKKWGIPEEVFFKYIDLQDETNPTVGELLDI
jgi:anaerobic magnesium-protoporphyrin IX monomethyl ester cyclase